MSGEIKTVLQLDTGESYEWDIVELGKDQHGNYWWRSGSGCSCDWLDEEDWKPLKERTEFYKAIDHCGYGPGGEHAASRADFRSKVMKELGGA